MRGLITTLAWVVAACSDNTSATATQLGKLMFEDRNLSTPAGQACADCHAQRAAFRDPESDHTSSMGVVEGRFGKRNAPSLLYARFVPPFRHDPELGPVGGLFWDGRAASLEAQIQGPLLEPLEMNNPDKASVVARVRRASYAGAVRDLYGAHVLDDADRGFTAIATAIAAFERGHDLAPFSSRYDRYLAGERALSAAELRGLAIFEDPARGGCASCHPNRPGLDGSPPLFTNVTYANLGIPRYANNKYLMQPLPWNPDGASFIDLGLGAITRDPLDDGKFRVPTLRDVTRTGPYGHNGYFANLPYMLEFVANRDAGSFDVGTCTRIPNTPMRCPWPEPEVAANLDRRAGTHLLSNSELSDLADFLATLDDASK